MRDGRIGRQTALDQPRRSRRLDNAVLARAASVFGPANDQDPELRGNDIEPLAHIFTNAAQRALAARAILVLDVDHRLDARQMGGKRTAIDPALGGMLGGSALAGFRLARGLRLLGILKGEQHLIFRQALGATSKTMPLQFLDDLTQALVLDPLGDQHRLQRSRIFGQRFNWRAHEAIESHLAWLCESSQRAFARQNLERSSRLQRRRRLACLMHPAPIEAFHQRRELRRGQPDHSIVDLRPAERAVFQPLGKQTHACAIPVDQLHPIGALRPEHIDGPRERVGPHRLAYQRGQALGAFAEVHRLGRNHHPNRARGADHLTTFSTRMIAVTVATSALP